MPKYESGRVRWFNPTFGYGFIKHPNGEDVFVHYKDVVPTTPPKKKSALIISKHTGCIKESLPGRVLNVGERVIYKYEETDRGLKALEVKRIK